MTREEFEVFKVRRHALRVGWGMLNVPYRYGGPERAPESGPWYFGLDCSGFSGEYLKSVNLVGHNERLSAAMQFGRFSEWIIPEPVFGGLVFWFNGHAANHVCVTIGDALCLGAIGGDRDVTSLEIALQRDARVKVRPISYRSGRRVYVDPFSSLTSK